MRVSKKRKAELLITPYLEALDNHELALSSLYTCLSKLLPEGAVFWRELAKEEVHHSKIVKLLHKKILTNHWRFQRPEASYATVQSSSEWVVKKRKDIEKNGISMHKALELALFIEDTIIERDFFKVAVDDNDGVREAFTEIQGYTLEHRQRVEKEAGRIKWKLVGNKIRHLSATDMDDCCIDTDEKVRIFQKKIITMLIRLEESAEVMYSTFAEIYKPTSALWAKIGAEEMQHAQMLRTLLKMREQGTIFYNLGRFDLNEIEQDIEYALSSADDAKVGKVTLRDAKKRAIVVESSMTESKFYEIVEADSDAFKLIARKLSELSKRHIQKINDIKVDD